jgi:hypothetical protein
MHAHDLQDFITKTVSSFFGDTVEPDRTQLTGSTDDALQGHRRQGYSAATKMEEGPVIQVSSKIPLNPNRPEPLVSDEILSILRFESGDRLQQEARTQLALQEIMRSVKNLVLSNKPEGAQGGLEEGVGKVASKLRARTTAKSKCKNRSGNVKKLPTDKSRPTNSKGDPSPSEPSSSPSSSSLSSSSDGSDSGDDSSSNESDWIKKNKHKRKSKKKRKRHVKSRYPVAPMPKVESKTLAPFSGSDDPLGPVYFIKELKLIKQSRGLKDKFFIKHWVPPFLKSDALEWWTENLAHFTDWATFETLFLQRFRTKNHTAHIMERLRSLQQGADTYSSYHAKCVKLVNQVDSTVDMQSKIAAFRHGTKKSLFKDLSLFDFDSLDEFREKAIAIELAEAELKVMGASANSETRNTGNVNKRRPFNPKAFCTLCQLQGHWRSACFKRKSGANTGDGAQQGAQTNDKQNGNSRNGRGGRSGNTRGRGRGSVFPHNQNFGSGPPKPACTICGKTNHAAATCYLRGNAQLAQVQTGLNLADTPLDFSNPNGGPSFRGGMDRR